MNNTTAFILKKYLRKEKLTMVTSYDATMTKMVEAAGIDMILVGDSLGNVIQGHGTTLPVTLDEMIYHCKCVTRVSQSALIVGDMTFGSYQDSLEHGLSSCIRVMKEGGVGAIKLEGGARYARLVKECVHSGIPVMGHLGLTPQSVHALGGFKVQAKDEDSVKRLIADAKALEEAGVFAIVLECVPEAAAKAVTESIDVPTIGIGAGKYCSGQVLVLHDMLGLNLERVPKFVKVFADLGNRGVEALKQFKDEVSSETYPSDEYSYR